MAIAQSTTPAAPRIGASLSARLVQLKGEPRKPGEASFFFHDAFFKNDAVKILPGEYFVHDEDILIMTTLGSCIAACLWDREARVGGMNHFMLPEGDAGSGRYGSFAMELLINEMLKRGATRSTMEAKVFGGGQVVEGMSTMNIGERNTAFVMDYLKTERIPILSKDVLGPHARKLCFLPASGKALVKRITATNREALAALERAAARSARPVSTGGGSVDLF
jgi:chemotaxis protein CheD